MNNTALSADSMDALDPALAHRIEEAVLFGSIADIDAALDLLADDVRVSDDLRYGLESLRYFREHYAGEAGRLSDTAQHQFIKLDAEWTMRLIQKLHDRRSDITREEKSA